MCEWGNTTKICVKIPADLSSTGQVKWKWEDIDGCIAWLVRGLQRGGIDMRGSCCGHGKDFAHINLVGGQVIIIADRQAFNNWRGWLVLTFKRALYCELHRVNQRISEFVWKLKKNNLS